jgi:hypothetical protein
MSDNNNNPIGVLTDKDNLEVKIQLIHDTMSHLLAETAELDNPTELRDVLDLMRNLNELSKQLENVLYTL